VLGDRRGQGYALNNIGWYHAGLDDYDLALTFCQQAFDRLVCSLSTMDNTPGVVSDDGEVRPGAGPGRPDSPRPQSDS